MESIGPRSQQHAQYLDKHDELNKAREYFFIPSKRDLLSTHETEKTKNIFTSEEGQKDCVYLCGNSLGLQPRSVPALVQAELDKWQKVAVIGHWTGERPWLNIDSILTDKMARVVGALPIEVAVMGTLTNNNHTLMIPFYRPTAERYKIIIEKGAFPSDLYLVNSQVAYHGFDPKDAVIKLEPRSGEYALRTEDIIDTINKTGSQLALLFLPGIQFYTGQLFKMEELTRAAQKVGAIVGWDLAHAVGNVKLCLHDWNVDFATWCTYKYLNSGPGSIAGIFVHERYAFDKSLRKLSGWWGHDESTRFQMDTDFSPIPGAYGFRLSNSSVLNCVCLLSSLEIFDKIGMDAILKKQKSLILYLEELLQVLADQITIITPASPNERGNQLSLMFKNIETKLVEEKLLHLGIVVDARANVIRVAPAPLYNSYEDIYIFVNCLKNLFNEQKV